MMSVDSGEICIDGASKSSSKDSASKSSSDGICEVKDMLQNMSMDDKDILSICANCGKEGNDVNNICNKCKQVKYCNAVCKKKHRHKHKKQCEEHVRLAAQRAAKLYDEELFKQPPPLDDCPICFLPLPSLESGKRYKTCCGKVICSGCSYAPVYDDQGNKVDEKKCAFCRIPLPDSDEEIFEREKKRIEKDDPIAIHNRGIDYRDGTNGFPQDYKKAFEFWHRAGKLGYALAYCNVGYVYNNGRGVEIDKKKAIHYYELAAMRGNELARCNLGIEEIKAGNYDRAFKHFMIAVQCGDNESLETIQKMYSNGFATKEDYTKALRAYQEYLNEIKSPQRDEAATANETLYRYY